jgi:hypothetical protein
MPPVVTSGSLIMCTFGTVPTPLVALPSSGAVDEVPVATIDAIVPFENIEPFGMCDAPSNPEVIAQLGAPAPCVPVVDMPWEPPAVATLIDGLPAVTAESRCLCTWGGVISVLDTMGIPWETD